MVEIQCPDDCRFLEAAHRHPAAQVKRQIDHDLGILMPTLGRLSEPQLQLFFVFQSVILGHTPDTLARLADADVALAVSALAASLETASRGVIYEEATPSTVAEGLRRALKPLIEEVVKNGGSRAEREVAVVLRGIERGARHEGGAIGEGETAYLELVRRVMQQRPQASPPPKPLIVTP